MINNIIKLFYSEVVKTKMSNMPNEDYELRDGCKKFRKITLKIDSYLFKGLKIILALFILYLSIHVKIYLLFQFQFKVLYVLFLLIINIY